MWDARNKSRLENAVHEAGNVLRGALSDRRNIGRDFSRLALGGPATRTRFARLLAKTKPRTNAFTPSPEAAGLAGQLLDTGYTGPLGLVTPDQVAEIRDYLIAQPYYDPIRPHLGEFQYPTIPSEVSNQAYYSDRIVLEAPHLLALANHPLILQAAEAILGCKPLLENIVCGWYFTGRDMARGVQRFHRDFDTPRFIKVFLYLTDIDERSGPHIYVPGSQRSPELMLRRYIGDDEVEASFGKSAIVPICGPAGTCFLVDTFGIHKGGLPVDRPRLIFSAQYNIWGSPYAPGRPPFPNRAHPYDRYVNRAYFGD
jgi:hypothetical protein